MATPTLTAPSAQRLPLARPLAGCLAALWGTTLLAALATATTPQMAAHVKDTLALPLTPTPGSLGEVLDILTTNARVLGAIALAALSVRHARALAPALDFLVVVLAAGNAVLVGAAIGAYGPQTVRWLAHLPLEWAALATTLAGYLHIRRGAPMRAHTAGILFVLTAVLLIAAAVTESFSTPALVGE